MGYPNEKQRAFLTNVPSHKKDKVGTVTHEKDTEMGEAGSDDSDHGS